MDRFGLGYATLSAAHLTLIYCAVSAYGAADRWPSARLRPDHPGRERADVPERSCRREPHKTAIPIIDLTTGMFAAHAVLAALYARCSSGRGQFIDAAVRQFRRADHLPYDGVPARRWDPARLGNSSAVAAPVDCSRRRTAASFDRGGDRVWQSCIGTGNPPEQPARTSRNFLRVRHQARLVEILKRIFREERLDT